ncbi:MAG: hydrogenase [Candidatus Omnitrophica bacterium]|nr:hydrogenase [Candidatus Omnitrophota bacterium]
MLSVLILIPFVCGLVVFLPMERRLRVRILCAVSLVHAMIVASFWKVNPPSEINGFLMLDAIGLIVLSIVSFLFLSVSVYMVGYFHHEQRRTRTFVACLLLLLSTMTLVSVSRHMGLLWVAIEATTLFSAPLISFHRNPESLEATWKYLLVCSVGIALALLGTFFLAIAAHDVHTLLLPVLLSGAKMLSVNWLKLSVIFLLVGYGCKMGLAPMHSWKPEAYGQAPGMIAALMSGALTQCSFLALIRVSQICAKTGLSEFYASILIVTGALSLVAPAIFILGEGNIKRAFAYSSVEHMGILVLGLGLGPVGIFGAFFHMINNAVAKVAAFLAAGSLAQKYGSSRATEVKGVIHLYPVTGVLLIAGFLAGTGMFPFATFHSELMILNAAVLSGHYLLALVYLGGILVMFIGVLRIVLEMALGKPTQPVLPAKENFLMNAAIAVAMIISLGLGLWMPDILTKVLNDAVALVRI